MHVLYAQQQIPEFGQFGGEELIIQECSFDKEADAVVLFDIGSSGYNDQYNLITLRRIRFKILKPKGIDKANIEISYYSKEDFETVSNIRAVTYTRSGDGEIAIRELDRKTIFRQKITENVSLVKFTVPNVKVGTIVDYEYMVISKHYGGLDDWYFQSETPVMLSRYILTMVPSAEFSYIVHKSPGMPVKIESDKNAGNIVFEMSNVAGLRYEPFMDAAKNYLQYVEFQLTGYLGPVGNKVRYMTTWKEAALELMGAHYFGKQLERKLAGSEVIMTKVDSLPVPYDKMKFIYEYVKNAFSWNNTHSRFAYEGLKDVWENKKGSNGEINLVLINLLKQAGLQADPMLVSERWHGRVKTEYPMLDEFNTVVAYTVIGEKKFILDATKVYTPPNLIPFRLLNTNAFIVNRKKPVVIRLTDTRAANNLINIYADIDSDGIIKGYTNIHSYDYAKVSRLEDYMEDAEKFEHDYFVKNYTPIRIDSFEVRNTKVDSLALLQQFKFSMPAAASGDYKLVNVNLFGDLEKNVFTLDNRFSDVDFGCMRRTDILASFELPGNMKPEEMPKNVQLVTPDKSISFMRTTNLDGNVISIQISLKINQTLFTVEDYPILKEFYKKMHNMLDEQIVLSLK